MFRDELRGDIKQALIPKVKSTVLQFYQSEYQTDFYPAFERLLFTPGPDQITIWDNLLYSQDRSSTKMLANAIEDFIFHHKNDHLQIVAVIRLLQNYFFEASNVAHYLTQLMQYPNVLTFRSVSADPASSLIGEAIIKGAKSPLYQWLTQQYWQLIPTKYRILLQQIDSEIEQQQKQAIADFVEDFLPAKISIAQISSLEDRIVGITEATKPTERITSIDLASLLQNQLTQQLLIKRWCEAVLNCFDDEALDSLDSILMVFAKTYPDFINALEFMKAVVSIPCALEMLLQKDYQPYLSAENRLILEGFQENELDFYEDSALVLDPLMVVDEDNFLFVPGYAGLLTMDDPEVFKAAKNDFRGLFTALALSDSAAQIPAGATKKSILKSCAVLEENPVVRVLKAVQFAEAPMIRVFENDGSSTLGPGDLLFSGYHFDSGVNGKAWLDSDALWQLWFTRLGASLEQRGCALMPLLSTRQQIEAEQVHAVLNGSAFERTIGYVDNTPTIAVQALLSPLFTLLYPLHIHDNHYGLLVLRFNESRNILGGIYFEPYLDAPRSDFSCLLSNLTQAGAFSNTENFAAIDMCHMGQKDDIYCGDYVTALLETLAHDPGLNLLEFRCEKSQFRVIHEQELQRSLCVLLDWIDLNPVLNCDDLPLLCDHLPFLQSAVATYLGQESPVLALITIISKAKAQIQQEYQGLFSSIAQRELSADEIEYIRATLIEMQGLDAYLYAQAQRLCQKWDSCVENPDAVKPNKALRERYQAEFELIQTVFSEYDCQKTDMISTALSVHKDAIIQRLIKTYRQRFTAAYEKIVAQAQLLRDMLQQRIDLAEAEPPYLSRSVSETAQTFMKVFPLTKAADAEAAL